MDWTEAKKKRAHIKDDPEMFAIYQSVWNMVSGVYLKGKNQELISPCTAASPWLHGAPGVLHP